MNCVGDGFTVPIITIWQHRRSLVLINAVFHFFFFFSKQSTAIRATIRQSSAIRKRLVSHRWCCWSCCWSAGLRPSPSDWSVEWTGISCLVPCSPSTPMGPPLMDAVHSRWSSYHLSASLLAFFTDFTSFIYPLLCMFQYNQPSLVVSVPASDQSGPGS